MTFILVHDACTDVILGNPLSALIKYFTIDGVGIHTKIKGKEVTFKLLFTKQKTIISSLKEQSFWKDAHINYLKSEVQLLNIKKLELPELKNKIKLFKDQFEKELRN